MDVYTQNERVYIKRSSGELVLLRRKEMDRPWRFRCIGRKDGIPIYELRLVLGRHLKVIK